MLPPDRRDVQHDTEPGVSYGVTTVNVMDEARKYVEAAVAGGIDLAKFADTYTHLATCIRIIAKEYQS